MGILLPTREMFRSAMATCPARFHPPTDTTRSSSCFQALLTMLTARCFFCYPRARRSCSAVDPRRDPSSAATTPIGDGFLRVGTWASHSSQHRECPCTKLDVAAHLGRLGRPFRLKTIGGTNTCHLLPIASLASFPWYRGCLQLCV